MVKLFADDPIEEEPESDFDPRHLRLRPGRAILLNGLIGVGALGVLLVVLMKPPLDFSGIASDLFQPGALGDRLGLQLSDDTMRPMP